jgi:hypothetical protein
MYVIYSGHISQLKHVCDITYMTRIYHIHVLVISYDRIYHIHVLVDLYDQNISHACLS